MIRYTYLIEDNNGLVKIGSSNDPKRRLQQLRTHFDNTLVPRETDRKSLRILDTYGNDFGEERYQEGTLNDYLGYAFEDNLQGLLQDFRYFGEWFDFPPLTYSSLLTSFAHPMTADIYDDYLGECIYKGNLFFLHFDTYSEAQSTYLTQKSAKAATKADSQLLIAY